MNLVEYDIGAPGIDWVRYCLTFGKPLGRFVVEAIDLNVGRVRTRLPAGTSSDQVRQLHEGGILPPWNTRSEMGAGDLVFDTDAAIVEIILQNLAKSPTSNICLFEDPIARAFDPDIGLDGDRSRACGDGVYLLLDARAGAEDVRRTLSLARPAYPPFVAILTSVRNSPLPVGALTLEDLKDFASRTQGILVGAYDGEAFAIWDRGQLEI